MSKSQTGPEHLIQMANDIGHFFAGNSERDAAIAGICNHIKSFWTPKMQSKLLRELHTGNTEEQLDELPREALRLLRDHPEFKPTQLPEGGPEGGGDAG